MTSKRKLRPVLPTLRPRTLLPRRSHPALLPFPLTSPRLSLWYLGRNALYALLGAMKLGPGDAMIVPSYTNGVEVAAIAARGIAVHTTPVRKDLALDTRALETALVRTGARAVLLIHYLGFPQPVDAVAGICRRHGAALIEDCALSFLAKLPDGRPAGSIGAAAIFSLYKTLPVPDGAALVINDPSIPDPVAPVEPELVSSGSGLGRLVLNGARSGGAAGQAAARALDLLRRGAGRALESRGMTRTAAGSMKFETERLAWGASRFTRAILPRLDHAGIAWARRRNFARMRERLPHVETFFRTLPAGACPLFYPVIVEDKERLMRDLAAREIETVNFWSTWHPATPAAAYPHVKSLREHVVELPCHQDLDEADIDVIADAVVASLEASTVNAGAPTRSASPREVTASSPEPVEPAALPGP